MNTDRARPGAAACYLSGIARARDGRPSRATSITDRDGVLTLVGALARHLRWRTGVLSGRTARSVWSAQPNRDGHKAGVASRQGWMLLEQGIQPACTMLLEAVDVAAVKAIPKGARTA